MRYIALMMLVFLNFISYGATQAQRSRTLIEYLEEYKQNPEQFLKNYPHAPQWESVGKTSLGTCIIETNSGTGTGFLVTPGLVVTNAHVVGLNQSNGIKASFCYYASSNNPHYVEKLSEVLKLTLM